MYYVAIFAMALFIVVASTPTIIYTAIRHQLFDTSDLYRKNHKRNIPNLGGVAIFTSFTLSVLVFSTMFNYQQSVFLIVSSIILFATGLKDDVYGIGTGTKMVLNIIVASVLVFLGDFKITSLYGVFNLGEMSLVGGALFSILLIIFLTNSFNLIDGIDGLAGTIGLMVSLSFGLLFAYSGHVSAAFIAFAMVGSLSGFLYYNRAPAKIFMGDTGSLIIGLVCATLAIQFVELNRFTRDSAPDFLGAPAIAVSILIIPVFDTLRIFFIRIVSKRSPFKGDRNHIHHRLQNLGLEDNQIVLILASINLVLIVATFLLQHLGNFLLIGLLILICIILNVLLTFLCGKKCKKEYHIRDVFSIDAQSMDQLEKE